VTDGPFGLQKAALAQVVERHPGAAGFLCVVESTAKAPSDKLRSASSDMIMGHGALLKGVACVIEGQGFLAAVNRGALASMVLLLRNKKTQVSVFATAKEGVHWLAKHVEIPSLTELEAAVEYMRSTLPPPLSQR